MCIWVSILIQNVQGKNVQIVGYAKSFTEVMGALLNIHAIFELHTELDGKIPSMEYFLHC